MRQFGVCAAMACVVAGLVAAGTAAAVPWATTVVKYDYDGDGNPANDAAWQVNPQAALGEPARLAGADMGYPGVVGLFNGPWTPSEIVAVGRGGQLVVSFDQPIVDDPSHLYGTDLIVFGHAAFLDTAWPNGVFGGSPSLLPDLAGLIHAGVIEVSADGQDWRVVPNVSANTMYPTLGYLDSGAYDTTAGSVPSNFLKPVNPAITTADFAGLTYAQAVALYDGSGGGTPVDLASVGLQEARFVRITVPQGAAYDSVEVDAFAVVPEPMSLLLLACGAGVAMLRRKVR